MKNLFLLLAFFCIQIGTAQADLNDQIADPPIENPLVREAFEKLVERAAEHGKDLRASLKGKIALIEVVPKIPCEGHAPHSEGDLGSFIPGKKFVVVLSKITLENPTSLEWTLAHEIGHGLGFSHTHEPDANGEYPWSAEIMSGSGVIDPSHLIYQIKTHPDYEFDIWERFFNQPQFVDLR